MDLNKFIKTKRKFQIPLIARELPESVEDYIKKLEDEIIRLSGPKKQSDSSPIIKFDPIKRSSKFTDQELEKECIIFFEKKGMNFDAEYLKEHEKLIYSKEIKKAYDRMNQRQNYRKRKISRKDTKLNIK